MSELAQSSSDDEPTGDQTKSGLPAQPEQIDPQDLAAVFKAFSVHLQSWWSGPLPTPSDFVAYNEAQPDASERILRMAERQQRYHMWNRMVPLLVIALGATGSLWGAMNGHSSLAFGGVPLGTGIAIAAIITARRLPRRLSGS